MFDLNIILQNILVINLDDMDDRYNSFVSEMEKYGIKNYSRVSACKPNLGKTKADRLLGNKISHLNCIRIAKNNNWEYVVICEDDLIFDERFMTKDILQNIHSFIKKEEWSMLYFGCNHKGPTGETPHLNIRKIIKGWAIHCYVVHSRCYDFILDNYASFDEIQQCDVMYWHLIQKTGTCFVCSPKIALQRAGFSFAEGEYKDYDSLKEK
ncbi:glycosyltransferase family 25 protein [Candidatus Pacearchaeota archaeon]|nr:glycosyltransferase family 25 protein [Candidatus Pacearchaeota archaeon]